MLSLLLTPTVASSPSDVKAAFDANGFVTIRQAFNASEAAQLAGWVEEVGALPPSEEKWMHHFERTEQGARLARTENFVSYHPQLGRVLMAGKVPALVGEALGEPVFLYKEKINYKYPGGAGYAAHQDAPAYKQVNLHATALIAIEPATVDNGCLEFAAGRHAEGLIGLTADGVLSKESEAELEFNPCEMAPGDVTIFSSYVPHRSSPNLSGKRRALLYLTYNAQNEGYLRDEYYRHKRANLKSGQLSLIKHFQGVAMDDANGGTNATAAAAGEGSCASGEEHSVVVELREMFATKGGTMYDPVVTQQEHALQSAAIAERAGASDAQVVAALLHDVGHLILDEHMGNEAFLEHDLEHELKGADYLRGRFPDAVTEAVRLHVPAKRYLCRAIDGYWDGLSAASKRSLEVQGGTFSEAEAAAFLAASPHAAAAADLRRWDDLAKSAGVETPPLEHYLGGAVKRVLATA